jgi:hypothetical protein
MTQATSERLEAVAIVYDQAQLAVLQSLLEDRGLHVLALSRQLISMQWDMALAFGGVRLCVPESEATVARARLAELDPWKPGRLFTGNRAFDLVLAAAILLAFAVPPPARLPATFLLDRPTTARRTS